MGIVGAIVFGKWHSWSCVRESFYKDYYCDLRTRMAISCSKRAVRASRPRIWKNGQTQVKKPKYNAEHDGGEEFISAELGQKALPLVIV